MSCGTPHSNLIRGSGIDSLVVQPRIPASEFSHCCCWNVQSTTRSASSDWRGAWIIFSLADSFLGPNSNPAKYSVGPQFLHCAFFFSFLSTPSLPYNLRFLRLGMDRVSLHHLPRCYRFEPSASVHECGLPCWPPNNISSSCPTSSSGRKLLYRCSRRADKRRDEGSTPYHCSELSAGRGELGKPSSTHGSQHRASYKSVSDTRFRLLAMR